MENKENDRKMRERIVCEYEDWDDTTYPHPTCHCLKHENMDCANGEDIERCPDFKKAKAVK